MSEIIEPCPKIDTCEVPVAKKDYENQCLKNWKLCFLNSAKLPSKWKEELKK